ncbi:ABC transporter permease [Novosphingobium olei]|uniref:ABC transporter permease n=1 Tax=Novosphingobium olei TaxID=2728851 RepID=UPI00309023BD|nr:ABC transporter permease [Novosphingobium olei]
MAQELVPLHQSNRTLTGNLALQGRVLWALLLREILTRYGRKNIGFLWLFVEPMLFTGVVTALWTATRQIHGSDLPIEAFALTGYSSLILWRSMPTRCIGALQSNLSLLFHRQVQIPDVYFARVLLEFLAASTSFVVLGFLLWAAEWVLAPEDVFKILGGWMLLAWFGAALGLTLGGLSEKFDVVAKLWPPATYILLPISGTAFIADALPEQARNIMLYLPMLNCVEIIREGWFGTKMTAHYDVGYVVVFNLILTFCGLALIRQAGKGSDQE